MRVHILARSVTVTIPVRIDLEYPGSSGEDQGLREVNDLPSVTQQNRCGDWRRADWRRRSAL